MLASPLLEFAGAVYHLTARRPAQQVIYRDDQDRRRFLATLAHAVDRYGWRVYAYCLMDNHYHLLIETPKPTLARGMRHLNGPAGLDATPSWLVRAWVPPFAFQVGPPIEPVAFAGECVSEITLLG